MTLRKLLSKFHQYSDSFKYYQELVHRAESIYFEKTDPFEDKLSNENHHRDLTRTLEHTFKNHLPLSARHKLARKLRNESRNQVRMKANDIVDVTPEEVLRQMQLHGVQRLIHGHNSKELSDS